MVTSVVLLINVISFYTILHQAHSEIQFKDTGNREPQFTLICFPGVGDIQENFRFIKQNLQETYRIITADLRGFGQNHAEASNFTVQAIADDYNFIMNKLNLKKNVILVGHGLAAAGAIIAAHENPKVSAVVFISPSIGGQNGWVSRNIRRLCHRRGKTRARYWSYYRTFSDKYHVNLPQEFDEYINLLEIANKQPGANISLREFQNASTKPLKSIFPEFRKPVLAMFGRNEWPRVWDNLAQRNRWLSKKFKKTFLVTVPFNFVDDHLHVFQPDRTCQEMRDFFNCLSSTVNSNYFNGSEIAQASVHGFIDPKKKGQLWQCKEARDDFNKRHVSAPGQIPPSIENLGLLAVLIHVSTKARGQRHGYYGGDGVYYVGAAGCGGGGGGGCGGGGCGGGGC